jgi:hypothetical protein
VAVSLRPCWVHVDPERVNTQAAPTPTLSLGPPISAVFPSVESVTLEPKLALGASSVGVIRGPCCVQAPRERTNTHAASNSLPISAVFPSADNATLQPNPPSLPPSLGDSLGPCCKSGSIRSG